MHLLIILKTALRALSRNKTRSLLTALGVIVGISAVIAVVAIGQGAQTMMMREINSIGNNLIMVFPGSRSSQAGVHIGSGAAPTLTAEDGMAIASEMPYLVGAVSPFVSSKGQLIFQDKNWATHVDGVSTDYMKVRNWGVESGEFFTTHDEQIGARVCVLGATVAASLFEVGRDPIGQTIRIRDMPFRVLGVMRAKGCNPIGQDEDDVVLAPYTTVKRVLQKSAFNNVGLLMVSLHELHTIEQAKNEIGDLLRQRHRLPAEAADDFDLIDMTEITKIISNVTKLMAILLLLVASISLLVGGIGIMNIMLVSVTERTREIGLRMAIGAAPSDILLQFLVEAMTLSSVGGLIGIALGVAGARAVGSMQQWPIFISEASVITAFCFSAAVGIFFGFYPALRASRLSPIDCLRYE